MRETTLPVEFAELTGLINYIQRKSPSEYSSSCPKCGGYVHQDGTLPDRFIMLMPEKSKAKIPFGWCRQCGYRWWQGQKDNAVVDPATIELLRRQAEEARALRQGSTTLLDGVLPTSRMPRGIPKRLSSWKRLPKSQNSVG